MRGSAAKHLLELWVQIPPRTWMSVSCECCVLSGRGVCVKLITRPEESYYVACLDVISKPQHWGGLGPLRAASHEKLKKYQDNTLGQMNTVKKLRTACLNRDVLYWNVWTFCCRKCTALFQYTLRHKTPGCWRALAGQLFFLGSVRKRGVGWFGSRCRDSILWAQNWESTRLECAIDQHGIMAALFRCVLVQKFDHVGNHHQVEYFSCFR
jgi:hypothetical protein